MNETVSPMPPLTAITKDIKHLMVDLETCGTKPYSAILTIGAYGFNFDNDEAQQFYVPIRLKSCTDVGLRIDADTMKWWITQSDEARAAAFNDPTAVDLPVALDMFTVFLNSRPLTLWGNSARFDMGLLEAAYDACGKQAPWQFWREGCYRTIKNMPAAKAIKLQRVGTFHHALDDAQSQALHLKQLNEALQLHL